MQKLSVAVSSSRVHGVAIYSGEDTGKLRPVHSRVPSRESCEPRVETTEMETLCNYVCTTVVASCLLLLAIASPTTFALQNGDVRLVNGVSENEGRVEVYYDGQWGTVCDDSWHSRDGDAICKQLGFESAERIFYGAEYGEGTGPIWIDQINCPDGAESILECRHNGWGVHDCKHKEDASVRCDRQEATKPSQMPVRLACPRYVQDGSCEVCPNKLKPSPEDCTPQVLSLIHI